MSGDAGDRFGSTSGSGESGVPPPPRAAPQHQPPPLASPPPPPPGARPLLRTPGPVDPIPPTDRERQWWGLGDVALAIPFVLVVATVGAVLGVLIAELAGHEAPDDSDLALPTMALFFAVFAQQLGQGVWPWVVSKWKGLGLRADWRFAFKAPADIGYGIALAILCVVGAGLVTWAVAGLVGLEDASEASNTEIISDNEDSAWIIGVVLLVVIGAPLTEELLFRGLILRAFEKRFGAAIAIIGSTILFTLPHIQPGATLQESAVLLSAIGAIGLVLAVAVVQLGRLGPAIVAHFLFNSFGTLTALAT